MCKELTCLDLRVNYIEQHQDVVPFFEQMSQLEALYLSKNPCIRKISMYRKSMTMALPNLQYLDERPVFEAERLTADAFKRGGKEEEERVRKEWADRKQRKDRENVERGMRIEEESRDERKKQFKKMLAELKESKSSDLIDARRQFKDKMKNSESSQEQAYYFGKVRKCEDLIRQDWHMKLHERGEEITPEMGKPSFLSKKQFIEDV